MHKYKNPVLFSLAVLPVAVIGGIFTCLYQFDLYPADTLEAAIAQVGSKEALVAAAAAQTALYALVCSFFGSILSSKTGLWKPLRFEKRKALYVLLLSIGMGVLFSLDYWTFGKALPQITESYADGLTLSGVLASILYGGIIEEVLLRLFMMSLLAFILWKLLCRKSETVPTGILIAANVIAALLFAAGHLPATITAFGALTPLILLRCFLLNGGFGLAFGWFYRKYGIQYAMLSHMTLHIVSKAIWCVFL